MKNQSLAAGDPRQEQSYFDGGCWGYLGCSFLAGLVTAITLGIAYPWMSCMLQRWKARHTVVSGKRMRFDGKGIQLVGKYLLWMLLTFITLGIYGLWMGVAVKKWQTKHTHFEGEPDNNSYFDGGVLGYFGIHLLSLLLTAVTLGIGKAWADKMVIAWEKKHTVIDSRRLVFTGTGGSLFGRYLVWGLLSLITLGIYAFFIPVKACRWQTERTLDHEHTPEALAAAESFRAGAHTDAVAFKTYRMQVEMEAVRAGVTDAMSREDLQRIAEQGARAAEFEFIRRYSEENYAEEPFAGYLKDSAGQEYAPAMYLYAVSGLCGDAGEADGMIARAAEQGQLSAMREHLHRLSAKALAENDLSLLKEAVRWHLLLEESGEAITPAESAPYIRCRTAIRRLEVRSRRASGRPGSAGRTVGIIAGIAAGLVAVGLLLVFVVSPLFQDPHTPKSAPRVGDPCPTASLTIVGKDGLTGSTIDPARTGKVTIIYFWNSYFHDGLPHLDQIASEYAGQVAVIAVKPYYADSEADRYITEQYPDSQILFVSDYEEYGSGSSSYIVPGYFNSLGGLSRDYPFTVILDENGIIQSIVGSTPDEDLLSEILLPMLGAAPSGGSTDPVIPTVPDQPDPPAASLEALGYPSLDAFLEGRWYAFSGSTYYTAGFDGGSAYFDALRFQSCPAGQGAFVTGGQEYIPVDNTIENSVSYLNWSGSFPCYQASGPYQVSGKDCFGQTGRYTLEILDADHIRCASMDSGEILYARGELDGWKAPSGNGIEGLFGSWASHTSWEYDGQTEYSFAECTFTPEGTSGGFGTDYVPCSYERYEPSFDYMIHGVPYECVGGDSTGVGHYWLTYEDGAPVIHEFEPADPQSGQSYSTTYYPTLNGDTLTLRFWNEWTGEWMERTYERGDMNEYILRYIDPNAGIPPQ